MPFAICRVEALNNKSSGRGSLGAALRHSDNHEHACEISRPELSKYNREYVIDKPTFKIAKEKAEELIEKHNKEIDKHNENNEKKRRHLKKNSNQFFEVLLTYSPQAEKNIDRAEWTKKALEFIKSEYISRGCIPIRCSLHCDEKTTHLSFIGLSWNKSELKTGTRAILGNKKDLSELQDRYALTMSEFGLKRGYSRYKEYQAIKKRAEAQGFSDVKEYARINGIELPKYRAHKDISTWKAEQQEKGIALEREIERMKKELSDLEQVKYELINDHLIPKHYLKIVENCETYESLLKIGQSIDIVVDGEELTITEYLRAVRQKDLQRLNDIDISFNQSLER